MGTKGQLIFNPFTPKIRKLILLTDDHTNLWGYSWEVGVISRHYLLVDNCLNSHYLSAWQCIKIVKRIYMLVTPGSERVKLLPETFDDGLTFPFSNSPTLVNFTLASEHLSCHHHHHHHHQHTPLFKEIHVLKR